MVYTAPLNGVQMKALETWIIKDGNLYQIVYEAPASNYDTYLSTAQQMINSFQIK